jgi:FkbM family methyltransferase
MGGYLTEEGEFYIKTRDGIFLYYNFSNNQITLGDGQSLDFKSSNENNPIEMFLMGYLRDSMVYFDVGANNGYYYSLKVAKQFPNCKVYAFEPDPKILHHLEKNIKYNQCNIRVIPQGLTDHVGTAKLTADRGAGNYIVVNSEDSSSTIEIKCNTLDHFVSESRINQIDFIKVDIEGGEYNFIKGAQKSIELFKPSIILELNDKLLKRFHASRSHVLSFLKNAGYTCFEIIGSYDVLAIPIDKRSVACVEDEKWLKEITTH